MTRAKERLVTLGRWPDEGARITLPAESLLQPLASALGAFRPVGGDLAAGSARDESGVLWRLCGAVEPAPKTPAESRPAPAAEDLRALRERFATRRLAAAARASRETVAAATSWLARAAAHSDLPAGGGDRTAEAIATAVGTAVHRFLERLAPASDWGAVRRRQGAELGALLARRLPAEAARTAAEAELGQILDRLAAGPLRERFDGLAGRIVARELPLLLPPPAGDVAPLGALTASVDLLYLDPEDGALAIADYKTDRLEDDALLLARHGPQLRLYAEGLAAALALPRPPRAELWLLRHGRVLRLEETPAADGSDPR
jgi:ATP-dependent exoDNAse (exonuclease V) beta subunit